VKAWEDVWADQARFNAKFRPAPVTDRELAEQCKDISLLMGSEIHEFLNTMAWKKHRNDLRHRPNMAHAHEELVDIFKYFVTLCNMVEVSPAQLMTLYWEKSAVCEQRYVEEWVSAYARREPLSRVAVVDLDNVVFDYTTYFGKWLMTGFTKKEHRAIYGKLSTLVDDHGWISSASTGIPQAEFEAWKHRFRCSGLKAQLPLMPHAQAFMRTLKALGYIIVVVTSRPIDRYPNLMRETLTSLNRYDLPYDHVWHGESKKTVLVERLNPIPSEIIAFDDDTKYVQEYISLGIPVFHVLNSTRLPTAPIEGCVRVTDLKDARTHLLQRHGHA